MKAAWYPGKGGSVVIDDLPDPVPSEGELLVRIHRCGICGTDLSMTKGEMWDYGAGQFGHEFAGEVIGLGKGVEGFRTGQKIAVNPSGACGICTSCADGANHVMCRDAEGAARGFAELARIPASLAVKLPDTLSMADGALVEPLAVSLYGVRMSAIRPGAKVLVLGGGTVALYAIYWARRLSAGRIVAASRSARRKDLCLAMGADAFVAFGDNESGEIDEALGGAPDLVYECVGAEGMLTKAIQHVKPHGEVISLGFCTRPDPIMPAMAAYKCATMRFLVGYRMAEFLYIADQLDKGHCDPKSIITSTVSLAGLPDAMARLRGPNDDTKLHVVMP